MSNLHKLFNLCIFTKFMFHPILTHEYPERVNLVGYCPETYLLKFFLMLEIFEFLSEVHSLKEWKKHFMKNCHCTAISFPSFGKLANYECLPTLTAFLVATVFCMKTNCVTLGNQNYKTLPVVSMKTMLVTLIRLFSLWVCGLEFSTMSQQVVGNFHQMARCFHIEFIM